MLPNGSNGSRHLIRSVLWGRDEGKSLVWSIGGEYKDSFRSKTRKEKFSFARNLRRRATPTETLLWQKLRRRQLNGAKFRRQALVFGWIVDFYCPQVRLVIEVDGPIHNRLILQDRRRDLEMHRAGFSVMRIASDQVEMHMDRALDAITQAVKYLRGES
jgi:very-short-patch-repair endonuclease